MSAKGLGVNGLKVDGADDTNALNAIDTISNLDNVVENTDSRTHMDAAVSVIIFGYNIVVIQIRSYTLDVCLKLLKLFV